MNLNNNLGFFILFLACFSMTETILNNLFKVVHLQFGIASY